LQRARFARSRCKRIGKRPRIMAALLRHTHAQPRRRLHADRTDGGRRRGRDPGHIGAAERAGAADAPAGGGLDNAEAGLPAADKLVGNYVSSVTVEDGAVHVVFGNQANGAINGHTLSFRPAVVDAAPMVPIAWVCGPAPTPDKMSAKGADRTDIPPKFLPINCRAG
jgi:hypothetical protein